MELDIVSQLKDFSALSFQRKLEIINKGRPTPDLKNLHQTAGKNKIIRCFQRSCYAKKEWLFGCSVKNRLFCFPCLLFSTKSQITENTTLRVRVFSEYRRVQVRVFKKWYSSTSTTALALA